MKYFLSLATLAAFLSGCGPGDDGRVPVTGTVKFKGAAIKDGAIVTFAPQEQQGTEAVVATKDGAFSVPKANGLRPGKYLIRVTLADGKTPVNPVDDGAPPGPGGGANIISKELIPKDWNDKSTQSATVTKDGPNKFDFNISP